MDTTAKASANDLTDEQWQFAELIQQNKMLKHELTKHSAILEAYMGGMSAIAAEAWDSKRDCDKAHELLRIVLVPLVK